MIDALLQRVESLRRRQRTPIAVEVSRHVEELVLRTVV
jgi:hypothetical protein